MNVRWNIYLNIREACKEEKFNSDIFDSRASPPKWCSKWWKEIREKYVRMLSSFISGKPFFVFEDNGNSKKYPEEEKEKVAKDIEICFKGIFRDFLKGIEKRYPEDIWKIKNCLENS